MRYLWFALFLLSTVPVHAQTDPASMTAGGMVRVKTAVPSWVKQLLVTQSPQVAMRTPWFKHPVVMHDTAVSIASTSIVASGLAQTTLMAAPITLPPSPSVSALVASRQALPAVETSTPTVGIGSTAPVVASPEAQNTPRISATTPSVAATRAPTASSVAVTQTLAKGPSPSPASGVPVNVLPPLLARPDFLGLGQIAAGPEATGKTPAGTTARAPTVVSSGRSQSIVAQSGQQTLARPTFFNRPSRSSEPTANTGNTTVTREEQSATNFDERRIASGSVREPTRETTPSAPVVIVTQRETTARITAAPPIEPTRIETPTTREPISGALPTTRTTVTTTTQTAPTIASGTIARLIESTRTAAATMPTPTTTPTDERAVAVGDTTNVVRSAITASGTVTATPDAAPTTDQVCKSRLFDCARGEQWPLTVRTLAMQRLSDQAIVLLTEQAATPDQRGTQGLLFIRLKERQVAQCTFPERVTEMAVANFSEGSGDLLVIGSQRVSVAARLAANLTQLALTWGPMSRGMPAASLCADAGVRMTSVWESPEGTQIYHTKVADLRGDGRDTLLLFAGANLDRAAAWQIVPVKANAAGDGLTAAPAMRIPSENIPTTGRLQFHVDPDTSVRELRLLIGLPGATQYAACAFVDGEPTGRCEEHRAMFPMAVLKGKKWSVAFNLLSDGAWIKKTEDIATAPAPGRLALTPLHFGVGPWLKREEKAGAFAIRAIDDADVLAVVDASGAHLFRATADALAPMTEESYPCTDLGCAPLAPLPVMIDGGGGYDVVYASKDALHFLPHRFAAPGARILVLDNKLYADRVCAWGEECRCSWSLRDANGTDLSFLLDRPTECVTGYGTNAVIARLDVGNGALTTAATALAGATDRERPASATVGAPQGDVAPLDLLKSALMMHGLLGPTAELLEQSAPNTEVRR